jgi:hypothetical protein
MAVRKRAITGLARPEGIIDDIFVGAGKKAIKRVTKLAENAALEARRGEKSFRKYQNTGSAYSNAKELNARVLLGEEVIAKQRGISLKEARKIIQNTPSGRGAQKMLKDTDKVISESRKVVDARKAARKTRRADVRKNIK